MTDLAVLNPEIEGLLREIAADPTSTLLRLPPSDLRRARQRGHLPDRAGTTGLNLAERELLRRWREEVAYLLLVACHRRQIADGHKRGTSLIAVDQSEATQRTDERLRAALTLRPRENEHELEAAIEALRSTRPVGVRNCIDAYELAAISARLVPDERATAYAALELVLGGNPESGVRLMQQVPTPRRPVPRRMHIVNIVHGYEKLRRLDLALNVISTGDWPEGTELMRAVSGAALAAQMGNAAELKKWALALDASLAPQDQLRAATAEMRHRRRAGLWGPTQGSKEILDRYSNTRRSSIEQVASAFA